MTRPTPWWKAIRLRTEITGSSGVLDDVQMSLFNAVYGAAGERPQYAKASYYGQITFPSENLVALMARTAVRLGGKSEVYRRTPALYRLDQGMGGGKSHGLVGLWHLAAHTMEVAETDVGRRAMAEASKIADGDIDTDLHDAQVVVLACDNMTAGQGDHSVDGPVARTLHERFLWRLFGGDNALFKRYQPFYSDKSKLADALSAVNRPILILVDEILDYVRQLSDSANTDLAVKDMGFLKALFDVVNDVPHVAMVVVMIDSEKDPMSLDATAQANRSEIEANLRRNGTPATVTSNTDFAAILRRRLFENEAPAEVIGATTTLFEATTGEAWRKKVFDAIPRTASDDFAAEVFRCYPFHPALIALAEQEWAPIAGFQKVRSTIKVFAATAYALARRGQEAAWAPLLIGPGDLPLSFGEVREAIIGSGLIADARTQANYRGIAAADIVGDNDASGAARLLDLARESEATAYAKAVNPRAAERMATALFLYSVVGTRAQGRQGATAAELKASAFVPNEAFGVADADGVLADLSNSDIGLAALENRAGSGGQPARLFLTTKQTLPMWFRSMRQSATDSDRDAELSRFAQAASNTGPFKAKLFIPELWEPDDARRATAIDILATAGLDNALATRLVVLDPRLFSLGNGADAHSRAALTAALGLGEQRMPVSWASSAVFSIINTQSRKVARQVAADYVAWTRVNELDTVQADEQLREQAADELRAAKAELKKAVRRAYQHVIYLGEDGDGRSIREVKFGQDSQTVLSSLDGSTVWAQLVKEGKAVGVGEFGADALLVNMRDDDYGRPLDELRDLFWSSPRMPLIPGGELDLKNAIFQAVSRGSLRLIDDQGQARALTQPGDIAVGSTSLRLVRPWSEAERPNADDALRPSDDDDSTLFGGSGRSEILTTSGGKSESRPDEQGKAEVQLGFTLSSSLSDRDQRNYVWDLVRRVAERIDEDASHISIVVKVVLPGDEASPISDAARKAGARPTVTPVD